MTHENCENLPPQAISLVHVVAEIVYMCLHFTMQLWLLNTVFVCCVCRQPREVSESSSDGRTTTSSIELDLSLDKITVGDDLPIITFHKASMEESEGETTTTPQADLTKEGRDTTPLNTSNDGEASISTLKEDPPKNEEKPAESEGKPLESEGEPPESEEKPTEEGQPLESEGKPLESEGKPPVNKAEACPSCEALHADEAVFLHIHVLPRPGMTYTYTPINNAIGIDIPKSQRSARNSRSPCVQQVKTCFCFAFVLKR